MNFCQVYDREEVLNDCQIVDTTLKMMITCKRTKTVKAVTTNKENNIIL